jgi:hypothetical protein
MNLTVNVNSTDRTDYIAWPSFRKEDIINSQVDTLAFETKKYGSKDWKPEVGDEIEVLDGSDYVFAGVIVQVAESIEGRLLKYRVMAKDWTHYLDRTHVIDRFENQTVDQIISYINTNYLSGFTIVNVNCSIEIESIAFNRMPVSKCLQMLAEQVNYNWYVDYEKDIHFFSKNTEAAPFGLTDTNGKYIFKSLKITDDLSQIRNRVFVEGGEVVGNSRTEYFTGDGTKDNFALANKFKNAPTVTVGGVAQDVGIDYLNQDADYDVLWNYQEKYIRFVNPPADTAAIEVAGIPLYSIVVQVQDDASILEYGAYEFAKVDKTIESDEQAKQFAISQLEAYSNKIQEGGFQTYESGLRSGQIINIDSDIRGISENFLIQRVSLAMRGPSDGIWTVELATMRTIGIIEFLQKLLLDQAKQIKLNEDIVLKKYYIDHKTINVTEEISLTEKMQDYKTVEVTEDIEKDPFGAGVKPDFVLCPYIPTGQTDPKREFLLNKSYLG